MSAVLSQLKQFLPQMQQANADLREKMQVSFEGLRLHSSLASVGLAHMLHCNSMRYLEMLKLPLRVVHVLSHANCGTMQVV